MRNTRGFYTRSAQNNARREDFAGQIINVKISDQKAWDTCVEWHHSTAGSVDFFCKTEEEINKIQKLKASLKNNSITSKAKFWAAVATDNNRGIDHGYGTVKAKNGKFGWFVPSFGEPDAIFGLPNQDCKDFYTSRM